MYSLLLIVVVFIGGCLKSVYYAGDPKGVITEYVSKSFSIQKLEDKKILAEFLTGDVKNRFLDWSDEKFQSEFINSKRDLLKLSFKEERVISSIEVQVTYEVVYLDRGKPQSTLKIAENSHISKITSKKLCQMVFNQEKWLIADVKNIKEFIEYQNQLSLP